MNNLTEKYEDSFDNIGKLTLRLSVNVWHQFIAHKCLQQASSLAFNTLLCLVPLQVAASLGVAEEIVHESFERFKAAGLICEVQGDTDGYLPARALETITLDQLVAAVEDEMTTHFAEGLSSEVRERMLEVFAESQRECLEKVTVASLL